jgi:hypothetical protein
VFAPPIFFGRNCLKIPAAVRMTDITWSSMIMANLSSSRGLGFPCSTYSISLLLADRVGYWDTDADAVGEDMHMVLKCFFKTKGFARMTPIFVPINLTNVESKGYLENLGARFVQAKRHYNGVADVAFVLRHAFNLPTFCIDANTFCLPGTEKAVEEMAEEEECPFFWFDKMTMVLKVLETHFMPVTSGWLMFFAVPVMQIMYFPPQGYPTLIDPSNNLLLHSEVYMWIWNILKFTTLILPLPLFGTLGIYEKLHRFIDTEFLNKSKDETRTWKNYFDYFSMPIAAWLLMLLPSNIASCKRIFKSRDEYIVAEKMEYRE